MTLVKAPFSCGRGRAGQLLCGGFLTAILATAMSGGVFAHAADGHPARIHKGTCEALGPVAFRLNGVGASVDLDEAPLATPTAVNPDKAYQVMVTETTIDGTIDDLLAADHAVMIYDNDEDMQGIACGNVGGAMAGDSLVTGLGEAGTAGHVGFAIFQPDGDRTQVTVILGHAMTPLSAAGTGGKQAHAEEGEHEALATPAA